MYILATLKTFLLKWFPIFTHGMLKPGAPWYAWLGGIIGDFLIIGGILFLILRMVPARYRKSLIALLTFLGGVPYALEFFWPASKGGDNFLSLFVRQIGDGTNVLYSFALGLGIFSLMRFHANNLIRKRPGWHNNLAFFVAFFTMMLAGFANSVHHNAVNSNVFDMLFGGIVSALGSTMFSTIGFFIVSAAYRAFRIRSGEATLMLAAAFVVMLGQVPVGAWMTSGIPENGVWANLRLENLSYWILNQPNMAAQRGMYFGIEIGALAMALRTWLSLERGSFFEKEL